MGSSLAASASFHFGAKAAMKMQRHHLIQQGPTWMAIATALLCAYVLLSNLSLSQPALW